MFTCVSTRSTMSYRPRNSCDFRSKISNSEVLMCLGHMVQPLLGKRRSIKCVVDDGDIRYVRNIGLLLQLLHIQHPVGVYLVRVVQSFIQQHKTGAATLLYWMRSFSRISVSLTEQGLDLETIDQLVQAAAEECIQYLSTLSISVNHDIGGSELLAHDSDSNSENRTPALSVEKLFCMKDLNACSEKETRELKCTESSSEETQESRKQPSKITAEEKEKISPQDNVFNSALVDSKAEYVFIKQKTEFPCIDEEQRLYTTENVSKHSKSTSKCEKLLLKAETEMMSSKIIDSSTDKTAISQAHEDIPIVELKMKNLKTEHDTSDETDWFFESRKSCMTDNEMEHDTLDTDSDDKVEDRVSIKNLKEQWDDELLNDIKDLKEDIENDLKILNERRDRLNKKLAKYIRTGCDDNPDDEFANCFEELDMNASIKDIDRLGADTHNTAHSSEVYFDKDIKTSDLKLGCANSNEIHVLYNTASNKTQSVKIQNEVVENPRNHADLKLFESKGADKEKVSLISDKLKCGSRYLNDNNSNDKVVSPCASAIKKVNVNNETSNDQEPSKEKASKNLTSYSEQTKKSHTSRENKVESSHKTQSSCEEQKFYANTNLHKIDSLLAGLGITNSQTGLQLKLNKVSRHLGLSDSDKDDKNDVSFTVKVRTDKNPNVNPDVGKCQQGKCQPEKQKPLEVRKRHNQDRKRNKADQPKESKTHNLLYELIRGLCPEVETGITEVVQQLIVKQLKADTDPNHKQRAGYENLSDSLIQCHSEVGVLPRPAELVSGILLSTTDNMELIHQWVGKPCRMVLVNGDLQPSYHHKGFKKVPNTTAVGGIELISSHMTQLDQWLIDVRAVLKEHSVNLVLVRGLICEPVKTLCHEESLVAIETVPYRTMEILAEACQTDMVTYITLVSENNVGNNITVLPWKQDWMDHSDISKHDVVLTVAGSLLQTVVFGELTSHMASLREQDFWECFHLVTSSLRSGQVLPGAGITETKCMEFCLRRAAEERSQRKANQAETYLSLVFDELAAAFKEYVDIWDMNTDWYSTEKTVQNQASSMPTNTKQSSNAPVFSEESYTSISHQPHRLSVSLNDCVQPSDKLGPQHLLNQSKKASFDPDDCSKSQAATLDISCTQTLGFGNCSNNIDDYATKLAAWRLALDTVFVILDIDSFIQTGLSFENNDRKWQSAL